MFVRDSRCICNDLTCGAGSSDSDCTSHSVNSSCVISKCRQHSAYLADALSPAVECQYQSRGSCIFQVAKSKTIIWPVRDLCVHVLQCFVHKNINACRVFCESFWFQVWAESNWASVFGLSAFVVENGTSELWVR